MEFFYEILHKSLFLPFDDLIDDLSEKHCFFLFKMLYFTS